MKRIFSWIRKQPAKCKFKLNLRAKGARFSGEYMIEADPYPQVIKGYYK
jgi:hypothetical protein